MNRVIKFRAWNPKDKQMLDWDSMIQSAWNTYRGGERTSLLYDILVLSKYDIIPMQFTGLHDKKGNEIYEGDLYKSPFSKKNIYKVVNYMGCTCGSLLNSKEEPLPLSFDCDEEGEGVISDDFHLKVQVIGNIYENPELIKKMPPPRKKPKPQNRGVKR